MTCFKEKIRIQRTRFPAFQGDTSIAVLQMQGTRRIEGSAADGLLQRNVHLFDCGTHTVCKVRHGTGQCTSLCQGGVLSETLTASPPNV